MYMLIVVRMVSISFDRPRALPDIPVPLPELVDDEYLSETGKGKQPQSVPSRLEFFARATELLNIRERLPLVESYHHSTGRKRYSGKALGDTLDLLSDLDHFLEALPPYLRTDHTFAFPASANEDCFRLQAQVLKGR